MNHYRFAPHTTISLYYERVVVCIPSSASPHATAPLRPAVLPAERANFDSELPHHPPKEIAYSDDNDSLQRDCPIQECEGH